MVKRVFVYCLDNDKTRSYLSCVERSFGSRVDEDGRMMYHIELATSVRQLERIKSDDIIVVFGDSKMRGDKNRIYSLVRDCRHKIFVFNRAPGLFVSLLTRLHHVSLVLNDMDTPLRDITDELNCVIESIESNCVYENRLVLLGRDMSLDYYRMSFLRLCDAELRPILLLGNGLRVGEVAKVLKVKPSDISRRLNHIRELIYSYRDYNTDIKSMLKCDIEEVCSAIGAKVKKTVKVS